MHFRLRTFRSLRLADYRWLWLSAVLGNSGRWALAIGVSWLVHSLTHSPFWVGASVFAVQGPALIVAPFAGVWADRFDRRRLLTVVLSVAAAACAMLAVLTLMGAATAGTVILLSLLFGMTFSVQSIAWNALLPGLVPRDNLVNAVSLYGAARLGSSFTGPVLASPLLVVYGPGAVFVLCFALYALAAAQTLLIRTPSGRLQPTDRRVWTQLANGFRYLRYHRSIGVLMLVLALHCTLTMSFQGLLPEFTTVVLRGDGSTYGSLMTATGLGAILATLLSASLGNRQARGILYIGSTLLSGLSLVALASVHSAVAAQGLAIAVGFSQGMFMVLTQTYVHSLVDDAYRGRVSSVFGFLAMGTMAVANWGFGGLGTLISPVLLMAGPGALFVPISFGIIITALMRRTLFKDAPLPAVQLSGGGG